MTATASLTAGDEVRFTEDLRRWWITPGGHLPGAGPASPATLARAGDRGTVVAVGEHWLHGPTATVDVGRRRVEQVRLAILAPYPLTCSGCGGPAPFPTPCCEGPCAHEAERAGDPVLCEDCLQEEWLESCRWESAVRAMFPAADADLLVHEDLPVGLEHHLAVMV